MPKLPLARVQPGQKLSRPVTTAAGVVMVQTGTELTAALIERLRTMGVEMVTVASGGSGARDARLLAEQVAAVEARFAGHEQDPWMMRLKDIVLRQLAGADATTDA